MSAKSVDAGELVSRQCLPLSGAQSFRYTALRCATEQLADFFNNLLGDVSVSPRAPDSRTPPALPIDLGKDKEETDEYRHVQGTMEAVSR